MPKTTQKKGESLTDLSSVVNRFKKNASKLIEENPELQNPDQELSGNPVEVGPRVLEPEEWAAKQMERATAAAAEWLKRVTRPRKNPIQAAIAAAGKRRDKLEESLRLGKWEKAMEKVDPEIMYAVIEAVGETGFKRGIENRKAKIEARIKELQPLVLEVARTIDEMPEVTEADREKRLLAARKLMIELGKKRRGLE